MTATEAAGSAATVGVLAQIVSVDAASLANVALKLGTTGVLLVAIIMLWRKIEAQDKADREDRKAQLDAMMDLIKTLKGNGGGEKN
jgi:hypothetical protein